MNIISKNSKTIGQFKLNDNIEVSSSIDDNMIIGDNDQFSIDETFVLGSQNAIGCNGWRVANFNKNISTISINIENSLSSELNELIGKQYSIWTSGSGFRAGNVLSAYVEQQSNDLSLLVLSVDKIASKMTVGSLLYFDSCLSIGNETGGLGNLIVGSENAVYAAYAQALGYNNKTVGNYGFAEGKENIADWGCHAEGNLNDAIGVLNHIEGRSNAIKQGDDGIAYACHVDGNANIVSGNVLASHVCGRGSLAVDDYSFIWNGDDVRSVEYGSIISPMTTARVTPLDPYQTHGEGSFNVNPKHGQFGFYIGQQNLYDIIESHVSSLRDFFEKNFDGDIYVTSNGKIYIGANEIASTSFSYSYSKDELMYIWKLDDSYVQFSQNALDGCSNMISVDIPAGISSLETASLRNCKKLTHVDILSGMKNIGQYAFRYCNRLSSIDFTQNSNLQRIQSTAFGGTALKYVSLPNSITSFGATAFHQCKQLISANVPSAWIIPTQSTTNAGSKNMFFECSAFKHLDASQNSCFTLDRISSENDFFISCNWFAGSNAHFTINTYDGYVVSCIENNSTYQFEI